MRTFHLLLAAAALGCPIAARCDTFTLTGSGVDDTFTLPSSPAVSASGTYGFTLNSVPVEESGAEVSNQVIFFNKAEGGGLLLQDLSGNYLNPFGSVLYTGTVEDPTFKVGTFTLNGLAGTYTLTIGTTSAAPTPEPASILLLGTGVLAAAFGLRRPLRLSNSR